MVASVAAKTHFYLHLFDAHGRGRQNPTPLTVDPVDGQVLEFYGAPTPPLELNAVLTGRTSGACARITKVLSSSKCVVESLGRVAYGLAFAQNSTVTPGIGETIDLDNAQGTARGYLVNHAGTYSIGTTVIALDTGSGTIPVDDCLTFAGHATVYRVTSALSGGNVTITPALTATVADNEAVTTRGGTVVLLPLGTHQTYPAGNQYLQQHSDSLMLTPVDPGLGEWVVWDRQAKIGEILGLVSPTGTFRRGDEVVSSSGGRATVLQVLSISGATGLALGRKRGTFAVSDTITNITTTGSGTCVLVNALGTSTTPGMFARFSSFPNAGGSALHDYYYEFIPNGIGGQALAGPGVGTTLVPLLHEFHQQAEDPADRHMRFVPFCSQDDEPNDGLLGGVTIQVVKCSGTFPASGTLVIGQTVTRGTWSGVVHGWNSALKYLYVRGTNGQTLTAGTLTLSGGATVTGTGAAFGWAKGSSHWNNMAAQWAAATSAFGAQSGTAPIQCEGIVAQPWETELSIHAPANGCPYPTAENVQAAWLQWISDLRTLVGNANCAVTTWSHRNESQLGTVDIQPGASYATYHNICIAGLPQLVPKLTLIRSYNLHEMASDAGTLYLRTDDYLDLGNQAFRHLLFGQVSVTSDSAVPEEVPVGVFTGQSQATGYIPSLLMMAVDRDPDLWPSAQFGNGLSTVDPNLVYWNPVTMALEPADIAINGNGSWGTDPSTTGPDIVVSQRMKRRFSEDPAASTRFSVFKFTVPGSAANSNVTDATACWDPSLSTRPATVANCAVTVPVGGAARGRFTASAGTFLGPQFVVNAALTVAGSGLGNQGLGGNNSPQWTVQRIAAVDPAGAWIEIYGTFAAEASRSFTITVGPPPVWPEFRRQWIAFLKAMAAANMIPRPAFWVYDQAESDLAWVGEYEAALRRVLGSIDALVGKRPRGESAIAKCIVLLHAKTPFAPLDDASIAALRTIQTTVAGSLANCVTVDPSGLPLEVNQFNSFPRTQRELNGVHLTTWGMIQKGFMIDKALATLPSIPAHPAGEVAVEFGAIDGGTAPASGTDTVDGGTDGGPVSDPGDPIAAVTAAMSESPDVASYTTPSGLQVQRRSADELIQLENHLRAAEARRRGLRQTLVRFD
jgi:hypothetical protein